MICRPIAMRGRLETPRAAMDRMASKTYLVIHHDFSAGRQARTWSEGVWEAALQLIVLLMRSHDICT